MCVALVRLLIRLLDWVSVRGLGFLAIVAIAVSTNGVAAGQSKAPAKPAKTPPPPMAWVDPRSGDPVVSAASAIVIDAETGKVLWSKDPDTPRYPASTTKIMTALLMIERCKPADVIVAPKDVDTVKEASMNLKPGEKITVGDMLYAVMLRSANDGCYAVARHIGGSVEGFSKLMNERARQLGCANTNFNNPNGLNDPDHTTTARDLAIIAREAMKRPEFRAVAKAQKQQIARSINDKDLWMLNKNRLLKYDPTVDGIKTGYTNPAGRCFVGSAVRDGYRVITVVLKSADWAADTKVLLDWAFASHEWVTFFRPGEVVGTPKLVSGGETDEVRLGVTRIAKSLIRSGIPTPFDYTFDVPPTIEAPVVKGQRIGMLVFEDPDGFVQRLPVVALEDVAVRPVAAATTRFDLGAIGIAGLLLGGAYLMRRKARAPTPIT